MLTRVRIQNFRCLRDVTLDLGPLTVFVGPNASGKTAIADCLTKEKIDSRGDSWCKNKGGLIALTPTYDGGEPDSITKIEHPLSGASEINFSNNPLKGFKRKFNFSLSEICRAWQANEQWTLNSSGGNLANFFDTLSRDTQGEFVSEFTKLVPMYSDIKARASNGEKRIQFQDRWHPKIWYEPIQVSDGTLLTAALVAMPFQTQAPDLAVIEDPDRGLHPYLQKHVVEMLRKLAQGKIGEKPIQIICTTHSRALLDYLYPEEVRFLSRSRKTGETEVHNAPLDNPRWQDIYEKYQESLGNMWMTGALGGVPGV